MKGPFTRALMALPTPIKTGSIADNDYIFELIAGNNAPVTNICNYFYFVDSSGDVVTATGGTVVIVGSPDGQKTWLTMPNGSFDADQAAVESRERPAGVSSLTHIKVTLDSVVAATAVGAVGEFIQTAGI